LLNLGLNLRYCSSIGLDVDLEPLSLFLMNKDYIRSYSWSQVWFLKAQSVKYEKLLNVNANLITRKIIYTE